MSKTKKIFVLLCAIILASFTSCDLSLLGNKDGQIYFDFSGFTDNVQPASRSAIPDYLDSTLDYYIDINLEGTYQLSDTINLRKNTYYKVDGIPAGSIITANVVFYTMDKEEGADSKIVLFTGKSEPCTIDAGINQLEINMKDPDGKKYVNIYVSNLSQKVGNDNEWEEDEDPSHDGRTKETAFDYIQSALNWIANNGNGSTNYKIILINYDEAPFNQKIEFSDKTIYHEDNLKYKAASITITSSNPYKIALSSTATKTIFVCTDVPLTFKAIRIASSYEDDTANALILATYDDPNNHYHYYNVTLGEGTVFIGNKDKNKSGCAIDIETGTINMKGNARITNFYVDSNGGAVYIGTGYFNMNDNSKIDNCKASGNGGVFYLVRGTVGKSVSLNDNATITKCEAEGNGGVAYIEVGSFSMDSGSITKCKAKNGGVIYLSTDSTETECYLRGGEITGNSATENGGAIYLTRQTSGFSNPDSYKIAKLHMEGNIFIGYENDIYVYPESSSQTSGQAIILSDPLTTTKQLAALITYAQSDISEGNSIIEADRWAEDSTLSISHSKIAVRTVASGVYDTNWVIDENGKLRRPE